MMKQLTMALMMILSSPSFVWANAHSSEAPQFETLQFWDIFTKVPETAKASWDIAVSRDSAPAWAAILASSTLLYYYDEDILREVQAGGRNLNLCNCDRTKTFLSSGSIDLVRLPTDTGSALYFLGDGWTHVGLAFGMMAYGAGYESPRAWTTSIQLFNGMIVSTLYNQFLKRATGRESPNLKTEYRGRWRPFPSIEAYNKETAAYDAVPSGHIMTATLSFTVLIENFPEHKWWLFPTEVAWLSLLGLQMVNNGVHWASDYPLGIAMGYAIGKLVSRMGRIDPSKDSPETQSQWMILPDVGPESTGILFTKHF